MMPTYVLKAASLLIILASSLFVSGADFKAGADHALDHVIVKFKSGAADALQATSRSGGMDELLKALNLPDGVELREPAVMELLPDSRMLQPSTEIDLNRFFYLHVPSTFPVENCVQHVGQHPWVEYAELDGVGSGGAIPNDTYFSSQWHHQNLVTTSASIQTPLAWDIAQGATNIIVAVLDTGLTRSAEFTNRLVSGYNFVSGNTNTADDHGHGTAVAGVVAANANNSVLVAGVDWRCRLMPVKVLDSSKSGLYSWWAQGVNFAVNNGAKVINLSAGGSTSSITLTRAITNAIAHGVIFVTITHNDGSDVIRFPGRLTDCITVGATDQQDRRAGFSNYGPEIDLCAPGTNIYTVSRTGTLTYYWGSSVAAPQAAGVASLLASVRPDLTQTTARRLLCAGAEDGVGDATDTPGFDDYYGWGRLNAYNSLLLAQTRVDQFRWSNNVLHLSWPSPANASNKQPFQVQFRDLENEVWETAPDPAHYFYAPDRTDWCDTNASAAARVYRLLLKPLQ